jgi:hypothetical protein
MDVDLSSTVTKTVSQARVDVAQNTIDLYLISDEDAHYEQEILRDPYSSIKPWLRYIEHKTKTGSIQEQVFVFERACKALPRSYKLWKMVCHIRFPFLRALTDHVVVPRPPGQARIASQPRQVPGGIQQGQ